MSYASIIIMFMCLCLFRYLYVCMSMYLCLYMCVHIFMYFYVIIGECVKYFKKFVNLWCMGHKKVNILTEWCWIFFLCSCWIYWLVIYRLTLTEILFGLRLLVPITLPADDLHFGFGDLVDSCSCGFVFSWIRGFGDSWIRQGFVERHKVNTHVSFPLCLYNRIRLRYKNKSK